MAERQSLQDRMKLAESLKTKINKTFGANVLMTGKEAIDKGVFDKVIIPTPSIELNNALYCGGIGGIVELFGPPSSGKTSLAIETMAKAQKEDPEFIGLWLETEHSIFPEILAQHGIDLKRTYFVNQEDVDNAENALDIVLSIARQGIPNMIVVNSVAGLVPKTETEEDLSKQNIALTARLLSKFFRNITGAAGKNKITLVFINQIRDAVGVMFGDPTTTTGGRALGFYAHQRIKMQANKIQEKDPINPEDGIKVSCIVHKNRYAGIHNPNSKCVYYARYNSGIDSILPIPQLLLDKGIFTQGGAWWYYPNKDNVKQIAGVECKFNSRQALLDTLYSNKAFLDEVMGMIGVEEVTSEEKKSIDAEQEDNEKFMKQIDESVKNEEK